MRAVLGVGHVDAAAVEKAVARVADWVESGVWLALVWFGLFVCLFVCFLSCRCCVDLSSGEGTCSALVRRGTKVSVTSG